MPDKFGTFGSVASETPAGGGGNSLSIRASSDAFGGQVAKATEDFGKQAEAIGQQHFEIASESKANDVLANQWAPTASKLRADFDSARGQDKVHAYESYVIGLKQTRNQLISQASNPFEKRILEGYTTRHVMQEEMGARRELVAAQKEFSDVSGYNLIKANSGYAESNYNNPQIVDDTVKTNNALITKQYIDNGHDPNSEQGKAVIEEAQRSSTSQLGTSLIKKASSTGDVGEAYKLRAQFGPTIPGDVQLVVDNELHYQALQQTTKQGFASLKSGQPIPNTVGAPPAQVQATVANTAVSHGLDHNDALTVLRIESNDGQNVGTRGDIGQTGKGGTLEEQAANLVVEKKKANDAASKALGRNATPAEGYICYQQGGAGGTVLLKAAEIGSDQKAVDALLPFYKSRKVAMEAVVKNGGNATMTCGDFVDFLKRKYDDNSKRASVDLVGPPTPDRSIGDAIMAPHETTLPAVQPSASPMQALLNFDKKAPAILQKINAIPNIEVRQGYMKAYNEDRASIEAGAKAYTQNLVNQAMVLAADPKFTSMDQVPSDVYAALAVDHPQTISVLEKRAIQNSKRSIAPLDFSDPNLLGPQIAAHVSAAKSASKLGTPDEIFTKKDTQALGQAWDTKTTDQRLDLLNSLHDYLPDSQDYQAVLRQIRPDSPVTAIAGEFARLQGQTQIEDNFYDKNDKFITPTVVAQRLLEGEELLNPTKLDKQADGKSSNSKAFPMPPDDNSSGASLRANFNAYVGNDLSKGEGSAFRGMPALYDQSYQAFKAYYAAEASNSGVFTGELDSTIASRAAKAVIGTVIDQNNFRVIAPWGMDETTFRDKSTQAFRNVVEENKLDPNFISIDDVDLENTGEPGTYRAIMGAGYVLDKDGKPVIIKL